MKANNNLILSKIQFEIGCQMSCEQVARFQRYIIGGTLWYYVLSDKKTKFVFVTMHLINHKYFDRKIPKKPIIGIF